MAAWVADGLTKLPRGSAVPAVEANKAPFLRNPKGVAYYDASRKVVYLNSDVASVEAARAAVENFATSNWSSPDPHHVLLHEVGHYIHHLAIGDQGFRAAIRRGSVPSSDEPLIMREVGAYAATSNGNFVAEVFAGRCARRKFPAVITRLYLQAGGP